MLGGAISNERFVEIVKDFLSHSPKHEAFFAGGYGVTSFLVRKWAEGTNIPPPVERPSVIYFIEGHLRSCVCGK